MLSDSEYEGLKNSILALGPVLPGTIRKVYLRCGKKNCHCQSNDKKQWHGPYSFWDRKDDKHLSSRSIPADQVKLFQGWINKRRELERIVQQMLNHGVAMAQQLKSSKKPAKPLPGGKSKKAHNQPAKSKL
jgi:hypothetical protein